MQGLHHHLVSILSMARLEEVSMEKTANVCRSLTCAQSEIDLGPNDCVQGEETERAVSEEEMEAAALTWSKGLTFGPSPHDRQHPV